MSTFWAICLLLVGAGFVWYAVCAEAVINRQAAILKEHNIEWERSRHDRS